MPVKEEILFREITNQEVSLIVLIISLFMYMNRIYDLIDLWNLIKSFSFFKTDVTEWINPVYLDVQTQFDISEAFEDNSEISLPDFLQVLYYIYIN